MENSTWALIQLMKVMEVDMSNNATIAAIQYALSAEEGLVFLRLWNEGEFLAIRDK